MLYYYSTNGCMQAVANFIISLFSTLRSRRWRDVAWTGLAQSSWQLPDRQVMDDETGTAPRANKELQPHRFFIYSGNSQRCDRTLAPIA